MESSLKEIPLDRGTIVRQREVCGNLLIEAIYPPEVRVMNHWHAKANFCIALAGASTERYCTKTREFRPFTASFLPSEQLHSLIFHRKPMRYFTVDIAPDSIERAREYSLVTEVSTHFQHDSLTRTFLRLYDEFRDTDDASALAIEGLLFEMLALSARHNTDRGDRSAPMWLKRSRDLIRAHFAEQLSLTRIAHEVGVHPGHLAREFRKHYRSSLGEYLRVVRIDYACQQLVSSEKSQATIALAAGFSDQSHFARVFRRLRGTTPRRFRAAFKLK